MRVAEPAIRALRIVPEESEMDTEEPVARLQHLPDLYAIRAERGDTVVGAPSDKAFRSAVRCIIKRPEYSGKNTHCLEVYMDINGVRAFCLFDTGSTCDALSPDFARVVKAQVADLSEPIGL
jgi:hypothetical protein